MSNVFPNEPTGATTLLSTDFSSLTGLVDDYGSSVLMTDATAPVSPPSVIRSRIEAGANFGGMQLRYSSGTAYNDMFVGLIWRTNAGFQGRTTANKMFFVRGPAVNGFFGMAGTTGGPFVLGFGHNSGSLDNSHIFPGDLGLGYSPNNVDTGSLPLNTWTRIEVYLKKSTTATSRDGILRYWVNGALCANYANVNYAPNGLNEWIWSETWDGTVTNPIPAVPWEHYLDQLYISTGGTGAGGVPPTGGTPQVLSAPPNLYPNGITLPYGPVTFQWDAVPGAAQYALRVHKYGTTYDVMTFLGNVPSNTYTLTLDPSTSYDWWVHAVDGSGNLSPSNGALFSTTGSTTPPPPNPDPPPTPPPITPAPPPSVTPPITAPPAVLPAPTVQGTVQLTIITTDGQNPVTKEYRFYG